MRKLPHFFFAAFVLLAASRLLQAQDGPKAALSTNAGAGSNAVVQAAPRQADVASTKAEFGKIAKSDADYKTALDAHSLEAALKQAGQNGAFRGKVTQIFEPRGGGMAILNFDANYRRAITAMLRKNKFSSFPALTNLLNKDVLITGKFENYQGRAEIILTNLSQVKVAE